MQIRQKATVFHGSNVEAHWCHSAGESFPFVAQTLPLCSCMSTISAFGIPVVISSSVFSLLGNNYLTCAICTKIEEEKKKAAQFCFEDAMKKPAPLKQYEPNLFKSCSKTLSELTVLWCCHFQAGCLLVLLLFAMMMTQRKENQLTHYRDKVVRHEYIKERLSWLCNVFVCVLVNRENGSVHLSHTNISPQSLALTYGGNLDY